MRIDCVSRGTGGWLRNAARRFVLAPTAITLTMGIALLLPSRSFSQEQRAASHIKKPLIYQIGRVVHISADGPRPLLRAINALQEKYGWIVDYEDPQYQAEATRPSNPRWRHPNVGRFRGEGFSVEFNTGPNPESRPDENSVLTTVVDAYNQGNAVTQFRVLREKLNNNSDNNKDEAIRFDVVGVVVRDQQDTSPTERPVLDLPITLAKETRSAERTIALICKTINEKSEVPVVLNANAGNTDDTHVRWQAAVAVGGVGQPARTLLSRTLTAMGDRLYWRLLYDPDAMRYELDLSGGSQ